MPYQDSQFTQNSNSCDEGAARLELKRIMGTIHGMYLRPASDDDFGKSSGIWFRESESEQPKFFERRLVYCLECSPFYAALPFCDETGNPIRGGLKIAGVFSFERVLRSNAEFSGLFLAVPKASKTQDRRTKIVSWEVIGYKEILSSKQITELDAVFRTDRPGLCEKVACFCTPTGPKNSKPKTSSTKEGASSLGSLPSPPSRLSEMNDMVPLSSVKGSHPEIVEKRDARKEMELQPLYNPYLYSNTYGQSFLSSSEPLDMLEPVTIGNSFSMGPSQRASSPNVYVDDDVDDDDEMCDSHDHSSIMCDDQTHVFNSVSPSPFGYSQPPSYYSFGFSGPQSQQNSLSESSDSVGDSFFSYQPPCHSPQPNSSNNRDLMATMDDSYYIGYSAS